MTAPILFTLCIVAFLVCLLKDYPLVFLGAAILVAVFGKIKTEG